MHCVQSVLIIYVGQSVGRSENRDTTAFTHPYFAVFLLIEKMFAAFAKPDHAVVTVIAIHTACLVSAIRPEVVIEFCSGLSGHWAVGAMHTPALAEGPLFFSMPCSHLGLN